MLRSTLWQDLARNSAYFAFIAKSLPGWFFVAVRSLSQLSDEAGACKSSLRSQNGLTDVPDRW